MSEFNSFVSYTGSETSDPAVVEQACACLDRFTDAFNAHNLAGMDAQLHFPHVMLSGAESLVWEESGKHPLDFFTKLQSTGWAFTGYESKVPVLVNVNKAHFVVTYSRCNRIGEELSRHINLWVVTKRGEKWGIVLRSY